MGRTEGYNGTSMVFRLAAGGKVMWVMSLAHQSAVTSTTESRKLMLAPSTICEEGRDSRP